MAVNLRKLAEGKACVLCGSHYGTVLHHTLLPGNHGTGMKPPDFPWGVRLCAECHKYTHNEGRSDHKAMAMALGKQMIVYVAEGVLKLEPPAL